MATPGNLQDLSVDDSSDDSSISEESAEEGELKLSKPAPTTQTDYQNTNYVVF